MSTSPHTLQERDILLRNHLSSFIEKSFHTVNPGTDYLHNWHIDTIAACLEACGRGEITRLIINMPPRSLKSFCVSVAWPAWLLGHTPEARIIASSYSQSLSLKHSLDCRLIMQASWYQHLFPEVQFTHDQNEKHKFLTHQRGFRFATSVGGTLTGEGGDILIVDDPLTPLQARSLTQRTRAIDWFEQSLMTRLNDKKKGVIVIVMHRLHLDDLTGHLLAKPESPWQTLILPAEMETDMNYYCGTYTYFRPAGQLLHPAREGQEEIARARLELGHYAFAAQYQQTPLPLHDGMLHSEWFRYYNELPPERDDITQSWDTAVSAGSGNDYSVCTTWLKTATGYYLLDLFRKRLEYPELKRCTLQLAETWRPHRILIEDKSSGQSLLQDLRRETTLPALAIKPKQDKITRLAAVSPLWEAGAIFFPRHANWLYELETELLAFPYSTHDDQVDSISQYLGYWRSQGKRLRVQKV